MIMDGYTISGDKSNIQPPYIVVRDMSPIKSDRKLEIKGWAKNIDLSKIELDSLYGMIAPLNDMSDIDVLLIWCHFFLHMNMKELADIFGVKISQQRFLYKKYRAKAKKCKDKYNK